MADVVKKKRRSSRRTSLIVALQTAGLESSCGDDTGQKDLETEREPAPKKSKPTQAAEPIQVSQESSIDDYVIGKLRLEKEKWDELLEKYRNQTSTFIPEMNLAALQDNDSSGYYKHENEQIDKLEAKLISSLKVFNTFMEQCHMIRTRHNEKIKKTIEELYSERLHRLKINEDPRQTILDLFHLHEQSVNA